MAQFKCDKRSCWCYDYRCPCGAPYKYDEHSYHWAEEGELCAECDRALPDISCSAKPKLYISPFTGKTI